MVLSAVVDNHTVASEVLIRIPHHVISWRSPEVLSWIHIATHWWREILLWLAHLHPRCHVSVICQWD